MNELQAFLDSPAGIAIKGALVAAFLDFLTGSFAAIKDGTFAWDVLAAFLRKHILGRVAPLAGLLIGGYVTGDAVLSTFAAAGLTAYAAETIASIKGNLLPPKQGDVLSAEEKAAGVQVLSPAPNPVPTE